MASSSLTLSPPVPSSSPVPLPSSSISSSPTSPPSSSPSSSAIDVEPEVHIIGQIVGGHFPSYSNSFCSFHIEYGSEWLCVGGDESGQTHVDYPDSDGVEEDQQISVWSHPIDFHFYAKSLVGWPQIIVQCGTLDSVSSKQLIGYGFGYFPSQAGRHKITIDVWRPVGTVREEMISWVLGGAPTLLHTDMIGNPLKAKEERPHLYTRGVGKVIVEVEIMMRNFKIHKILTGDKNYEDEKKKQAEKAKGF